MKSKYFPTSEFLQARIGRRPSFAWRSILHGRDLLIKCLTKNIGNGKTIRVWMDNLIEDGELTPPWRKNNFFNPNLRVCDLIDRRRRTWDLQKLEDLFLPADIQRIIKIKPVLDQENFFSWCFNKSGEITVKSAYWLVSQSNNTVIIIQANQLPSINVLKSQIWKVHTDPKLHVFQRKILSGALPVALALNSRGLHIDERCQICGCEGESINHILFVCPIARQTWAVAGVPSPEFGFHNGSIFSNFHYLLTNQENKSWPEEVRKFFPWVMWRLWRNKNQVSFEGECFSAINSAGKAKDDWFEWVEAQRVEEETILSEGNKQVTGGVNLRGEVSQTGKLWLHPPKDWLKCNIGTSWSRRNELADAAWVLRDHEGVVLLHSRRAFTK
ncbi:PREDICTED: uncharacterized protein LOC104789987 [Camelina sativa]|uniref:Uncharacterized protein LOC104789987 n=1 Tax=Camelina sativa TaxID=90675 RepID=A0ABM1RSZ6_CAMSA|nr:PREDICTED: uncharacterized protein LOC104789987 [Camelina sativa]